MKIMIDHRSYTQAVVKLMPEKTKNYYELTGTSAFSN